MIGFFIIDHFSGVQDAAGFYTSAWCLSRMDMNLGAKLFLPPYLRQAQCAISEGDTVFGIADDVSGLGVALFGEGSADFGYLFDADIEIKKRLTVDKKTTIKDSLDVTKDIKSVTGDVIATTISLKNHTHPATLTANVTGTATPAGFVEASGPATGSTGTPT